MIRQAQTLVCSCLIAVVGGSAAQAADVAYLGAWRITGAVAAPWATRALRPDVAERARLVGKTVTFTPRAILAPRPIGCRGPHYRLRDFTADMLFQGAFDEMRAQDQRTDPDQMAARLGFRGRHIETLDTGCAIDFHFVDASTMAFALDNYVFTLKRL